MREALFILAVVAVLLGFTAFRYRKQIGTMIAFWRALKKMRGELQQQQTGGKRMEDVKPTAEGPLVKCSKCSTWVPEANAIKLGPGTFYCSSRCLETNVHAA